MVTPVSGSLNNGPRMGLVEYMIWLCIPLVGIGVGVGKDCSSEVALRGNT